MDDTSFRQLLEFLGLSWQGYRKVRKGVKRRIARHMAECGCRSVGEYIRLLDGNEDSRADCEKLMTVSISRFFRDSALWQILGRHILPELIQRRTEQLGIWCAGCACGEEVYSLKILWEEIRPRLLPIPRLRLLATDMNPEFLARALAGIYRRSSLKEVPELMRRRYFVCRADQTFVVRPFLKGGICWKEGNLLSSVPEGSFRLVFMRNSLLTYYAEEAKRTAFRKVMGRLEPGGYLIIGSHERIPPGVQSLSRVTSHPCIFQRKSELTKYLPA